MLSYYSTNYHSKHEKAITAEAEQSRRLPVEEEEKDKKQEKPWCKSSLNKNYNLNSNKS